MSEAKSEARSGRFRFRINSYYCKDLNLSVQSVPIPGVQLSNFPLYVKGKGLNLPDNNLTYDPITIQFIVSEDFSEWFEIYSWMYQAANGVTSGDKSYYDYEHNCTLTILDGNNQPIIEYTYFACLPSDLESIGVSYVDDSRVLTSSLVINFSTMRVKNMITGDVIEDL